MKRLVTLHHLILFALFSLLIASCTKEITPIGMGLIDEQDLLDAGYTDTVQIIAYSIPEDSIYTHNLTVAQVGSMYDPIFGRTTANFYTQILLTTSRTRFGTNPVFDSAFLYLPYSGSYGDTLSNMTLKVYSLTESIYDSLHSYSNSTVKYDKEHPIGELTFQPKPTDSAVYNGTKLAQTLRIPINSTFGRYILSVTDTTILNSNTEFVKFYKGICIIAEPQNTLGKGAILTFTVPADESRILLHYHNTEDTVSYSLAIGSSSSRFQNYDHNGYKEAIPLLRQQLAGNTSLGQQFLFAQGMAGIKIKIQFPTLSKWPNPKNIVLNDAQLVLGNASISDVFPAPGYLTLRGVGEAGSTSPYSIVDETDRSDYYDGVYNETNNSFRFRITKYIQQYVFGKTNTNGLHLILPSSYTGNRLVLNGTKSPQSDLKLYIRYTIIK